MQQFPDPAAGAVGALRLHVCSGNPRLETAVVHAPGDSRPLVGVGAHVPCGGFILSVNGEIDREHAGCRFRRGGDPLSVSLAWSSYYLERKRIDTALRRLRRQDPPLRG